MAGLISCWKLPAIVGNYKNKEDFKMVRLTIKSKTDSKQEVKLVDGGFTRSFDDSELFLLFSENDEASGTIDWLINEFDELNFEVKIS